MSELRTVGADDWQTVRDIRLDALREAPYAFASTYAREAAFPEQTWRERATSGSSILAYLPEFGRAPVGLVAAIQEIPSQLELVSMWVRPQARGRQVGSALVEAIVERARRSRGATGAPVGDREQQARPQAVRALRVQPDRGTAAAAVGPGADGAGHGPGGDALSRLGCPKPDGSA